MKKRTICLVITTRGNYAKMKSVMKAINALHSVELRIIVGGGAILPKYGNIADDFVVNGYPVDRKIHFLVEGENPIAMAKSAGLAVIDFATAFENLSPDVVIAIADRFETLSIAIAASYMNIPIAHLEGGEVSGSIDESIRHAVTKLSHLHLPATEGAARRIEKLGEPRDSIFVVGCPSLDIISELSDVDSSVIEQAQHKRGVGSMIDINQEYIVVIQHPVTTEYERNLLHINETIEAIDSLGINSFFIWPNMDAGSDGISKGIRMYREKTKNDFIHFFKSLPIEEFACLLRHCSCIVGNSSSGLREAAFLGTPCVNVGTRQAGRERGINVVDTGYDSEEIQRAIVHQLDHGPYEPDMLYGDGKAGERIAEILQNYEFIVQKRISF